MATTFSLHEVAAGVWAAVAPSSSGPAVSNAAIVDLGNKTLVVDTFMTVAAASELSDEARRLTGRAPHLVVNTHWHSDHVRGNRVFQDASIVGTGRMVELIVADAPQTAEEFASQVASIRESADAAAQKATTPKELEQAEGAVALAAALEAEVGAGYRLIVPDVLIGDRLDLRGERAATILGFGRGHTESDLLVHLPDDGIVIAGDLVWTGVHPKTSDGFPADWVAVLNEMQALGIRHVVAGHGPPGTAAEVAAMAAYLTSLEPIIAAVAAGEVSATEAEPPAGSEDWSDIHRFRGGLAALASR